MDNKTVGRFDSGDVGRFAVRLAATRSREEEKVLRDSFLQGGIQSVAVDFGGEFPKVISTVMEHALVAASREKVINPLSGGETGALVGAVHEVMEDLTRKANGLNIGGKVSVVRYKYHLCVAVFAEIGILNLNEITAGLVHRRLHGNSMESAGK